MEVISYKSHDRAELFWHTLVLTPKCQSKFTPSPPPNVSLYFMPSFSPLLPFFFFSCLHRKFSGDARFSRGNAISLSSRTPSSPPSQHLSHSKLQLGGVSGLAVITGRNHERGEEVDGNVCTRRGSGCRGGCDTCKSRPRFDPSPSCFETAFLFFTSEMKWSTTWVGLQWKWKLPSYFFFCVPVLSCSRTTLRLRFYSHLHTHLCLSAPQTETTKRWWRSVFFLSSTNTPHKYILPEGLI